MSTSKSENLAWLELFLFTRRDDNWGMIIQFFQMASITVENNDEQFFSLIAWLWEFSVYSIFLSIGADRNGQEQKY